MKLHLGHRRASLVIRRRDSADCHCAWLVARRRSPPQNLRWPLGSPHVCSPAPSAARLFLRSAKPKGDRRAIYHRSPLDHHSPAFYASKIERERSRVPSAHTTPRAQSGRHHDRPRGADSSADRFMNHKSLFLLTPRPGAKTQCFMAATFFAALTMFALSDILLEPR